MVVDHYQYLVVFHQIVQLIRIAMAVRVNQLVFWIKNVV